MKKRVMSMLMVMVMMVSILSVSVFAAHEGDCAPAGEWSKNEAGHWHACTTEGCEVTDVTALPDYAAHDFDETHKCEVCEYQGSHHWVDDATVALCACGAQHTHELDYDYDEDGHWQECTASDCPTDKVYNEAAHSFEEDADLSSGCAVVSVCVCGAEESEDSHTWAKKLAYDDEYHWTECSECGDTKNEELHYDYSSDKKCDACGAKVASEVLTSVTVNGLDLPYEGGVVDFRVTVDEERYGTPEVKWNKVTNLKNNTSVAMGAGSTFAAGEMYNVGIYVPINSKDEIADDIYITVDGQEIPYYKTAAAFEAAVKTYEGDNTVYMARNLWTYSQRYIVICAMFPELEGTHSHSWTEDWIETPAKHYLKCTGCDKVKDSEYHYDKNKSGLCDVCGFDMKYFNKNATGTSSSTSSHTHAWSTDWVEDMTNHWKQCTGCGAKTQSAAHADLNNTGLCDVCGFVMTAPAGHTHSFAADWTETFAQHYKVCSCGAKTEIAAHADLNKTGMCDVCGYAMTTLSNNGIVADTGDDNATFLWLAAFAVSALGAGTTLFVARKKREE